MLSLPDLQRKSVQYRKNLLRLIKTAKAGHTGGDLSCLDILNVLYNRVLRVSPETFKSPDRDYYIQSKGHCAEALFVVLADRGFFPKSDLDTLNQYGSHYIGHPTRDVNGVEQNTGALGHGLAVGVGIALKPKVLFKQFDPSSQSRWRYAEGFCGFNHGATPAYLADSFQLSERQIMHGPGAKFFE
jgi:transketolase